MARKQGWLLIGAAVSILILLTLASWRRIWEADFFWQYRTGEIVAEQGPPQVDSLSYVTQGRAWVEMRWLYCALLYRLVHSAGFPAAVALKWLVVLACFGLAAAASPWRRAPAALCAVLPVAILASTQRFFVRPELASYLFFSLFLWIIARERRAPGRALYALPFLQVLWSNLHTLFLLGPALVGLLLATEAAPLGLRRVRSSAAAAIRKRRVATIAIVLVATAAACLVTPYGTRGITFGLKLLREIRDPVFRQAAAELASPFSFGQRYTAVVFYELLLVLCVLSALLNLRRLEAFGTALLLAQLYLSATSVRNLPLFCLAAIPFVVTNASESSFGGRRLRAAARAAALGLATLVSLFYSWSLATDRFNVRQNDSNQFGAGLARYRFPEGATRFLGQHPIPGALFNPMFEGSYLVAHGFTAFIDPRLEVPEPADLARYVRMMQDEGAWREALGRYDFRSALVDIRSPFLKFLLDPRTFRLVYFDEVAAVFLRNGSESALPALGPEGLVETAARIGRELPRPEPYASRSLLDRVDSPSPYLRVAEFLARLGRLDLAEPFARDALSAYPRTPGAHGILGQILESRSDLEGALREYQAELEISPENALARRQAGLLLFRAGRSAAARDALERSVKEVPTDARVWAVLAKIHADAGRNAEALSCAEQAASVEPTHAGYVKNLGRLYAAAGRLDEGIATLERGLRLDAGDGAGYADLAEFLLRKGARGDALAALERGLAIAPADPELLRMRQRLANR